MFFKNDRKQIRIQPGKELSYHMKKNSTKWNSRAERGCRTATSSMRASVHPARRAFCMIGKFRELSYHIKKWDRTSRIVCRVGSHFKIPKGMVN